MSRHSTSEPGQEVREKATIEKRPVSPELVRQELDKILSSSTFAQSQRLSRFLRFVTEQFLKNEADQLKEYLLGITVFDRNETYDPRTDPIVRVEAGRVRTKLREYYNTDGREDPVVIDLPRGGYVPAIAFRDRTGAVATGSGRRGPRILIPSLVFLTALSAGLAVFLYYQNLNLRRGAAQLHAPRLAPEFEPIWAPFVATGVKTHIVFGSPFFLASPRNRLFLRPYDIRDPQGLEQNREFQQLQGLLGPLIPSPRYDYVLEGDSIALQRLTDFLVRVGAPVTPMPSYKTTWDAIQNGNIILLGASRMNHLLRHFPRRLDFEWESETDLRNHNPQPGEQQIYRGMSPEGFPFSAPDSVDHFYDYAVVGSFPGLRPNREILVVSAHGGPGVSEAVEHLTRSETIRPLLERMKLSRSSKRQYFQILLKVYVDRGVPVRTEYVTHHLTSYPASEVR